MAHFAEISQAPAPYSMLQHIGRVATPKLLPRNNFIKTETLAQVFSCEFCEIFKNTFFTEHLWTTTSGENLFYLIQLKNL